MPSTYTLNNGIELVATGEQSGTWGDTTNTNFTLLDTSLDGQVTVTLGATGSSGSPNTLPVSDGATSNGRNRLVIFADSGDLGGTAFVQLTPNDAEKIIYVRNNLSGSRSILLFQGTYNASNDYEVPAGTTAVVFFNGAGSGAVAANVFNNAHFDSMNVVGGVTITTDDNNPQLTLVSTDDDATKGPLLNLYRNSASPADSDATGRINFQGENSAGEIITYAQVFSSILDVTDGTEDGRYKIGTMLDGSFDSRMDMTDTVTVFNEDSKDIDFRVESNGNQHMLFVDAGKDAVGINTDPDTSVILHVKDTASGTMTKFETAEDGDAHGPTIELLRNSSSPADNDEIGRINFNGKDSGGVTTNYTQIANVMTDVTNGTEDGQMQFNVISGGSIRNFMHMTGSADTVFNEDSHDINFRVESDSNSHMLFVDAGNNRVGIDTSSPNAPFVVSNDGASGMEFHPELSTNFNRITNFNRSTSAYNELGIDALAIELRPSGNRQLSINATDTVVNQDAADYDFRVESDGNANMLFVDGGANKVAIGSGSFNYGSALTVHANDDGGTPSSVFLRNSGTSGGSGARIECGYVTGYGAAIRFSGNPSSYRMYGTYFERITGDGPTYTTSGEFGTGGTFKTYAGAVMNEGSADVDFRVESDSNASAFFLNGGTGTSSFGTQSSYGASGSAVTIRFTAASQEGLHIRGTNSSGTFNSIVFSDNSSDTCGRLQVDATNNTTSLLNGSDYRLKQNVVYDWDATTRLKQLKAVRFSYISNPSQTHDGFIAHELQSVVPEAASGTHNEVDAEGNPVMQGVDQSKIVPLLVKTIQELEARISVLES